MCSGGGAKRDPAPPGQPEPAAVSSSTEEAEAPSDLSSIDEPQTQPTLARFPTTVISGKARSFSATWYNDFKWLEYSKSRDAIFCKYCRHFPGIRNEYAFVREGFRSWKYT